MKNSVIEQATKISQFYKSIICDMFHEKRVPMTGDYFSLFVYSN